MASAMKPHVSSHGTAGVSINSRTYSSISDIVEVVAVEDLRSNLEQGTKSMLLLGDLSLQDVDVVLTTEAIEFNSPFDGGCVSAVCAEVTTRSNGDVVDNVEMRRCSDGLLDADASESSVVRDHLVRLD